MNEHRTELRRGTRVRLRRTWHTGTSADARDVRIEGTVAEHAIFDNGTGALLLTNVADQDRGWWAAPYSNQQHTTTVEIL